MGAPKIGTAYADPNLDLMFETYNKPNAIYYVLETEGKVIGCAGIDRLENAEPSICELQKMYFLPEGRGIGMGTKMIEKCLEKAKEFGFTKCYLETMPFMEDAQKLYKKTGFYHLENSLGSTGHTYCKVWMMKDLA